MGRDVGLGFGGEVWCSKGRKEGRKGEERHQEEREGRWWGRGLSCFILFYFISIVVEIEVEIEIGSHTQRFICYVMYVKSIEPNNTRKCHK